MSLYNIACFASLQMKTGLDNWGDKSHRDIPELQNSVQTGGALQTLAKLTNKTNKQPARCKR